MASKVYYFSGQSWWGNLVEPNDEYQNWSQCVVLDDESRKLFKETKLKNKFVDTPFGPYGIHFRRPVQKMFKDEVVTFNPPKVINPDGTPFDNPKRIGHGSKITCKVVVYSHGTPTGKTAFAGRLEAVRVDELVPYENDNNIDNEELPF